MGGMNKASSSRHAARLVLAMVGLPARGKTHIARRVARYLGWLGYSTRVFNVGNYRREKLGSQQPHAFFDPENEEGKRLRAEMAHLALEDLVAWMGQGGEVGIYDATNTSKDRRRAVSERCKAAGLEVVFIESLCEDEQVIASNIRQTKLHMPDYAGMDPDAAVADFSARIEHYARIYEPLEESEGSYVKLIDVGRELVAHKIQGYLASRLVYFLMNIHPLPRPIYLTRHGESVFNAEGRIGGDSGLSLRGEAFARRLGAWAQERLAATDAVVWTSTLRRTIDTAQYFDRAHVEWRALDEIGAGDCDGMTYDEIRQQMPAEFEARRKDKFDYRYPRGESYRDVIRRLEPVIVELERERAPVVIIAHQAVLRALYAYLMDKAPKEAAHLPMPLHTVIELVPSTYACTETRHELGPDTHDELAPRDSLHP
jgi:broad specificity phosphatase PhoE/predicted kinase